MGELYVSKIAELREKQGLTQLQLATALGVDPSTIRNLEKGRSGLDAIVRVARLCQALDCMPWDLYQAQDLLNTSLDESTGEMGHDAEDNKS